MFTRDGYRCTRCGKAGKLEAHHVHGAGVGDPYEVGHIKTFCRGCHIEHHQLEKMTPEEIEWRRFRDELRS